MPVDQRKYPRLALAIPVFLRNYAGSAGDPVEFASVIDVSAGGMLVVSRRSRQIASHLLLEIPVAPLAGVAVLPSASRCFQGRVVRSLARDGYHLLAIKFSAPLGKPLAAARKRTRAIAKPRRPRALAR
jgi:PilZ domain